jgi:hypothetical protein
MALTEQVVIDKIEVVEGGIVQVREATRVMRDGQEIAVSYQRWTLSPGQDVSDQGGTVQAVCAAVWTAEVVTAYSAMAERRSLT